MLTHGVVVVRGQERLSPRAQFELTRRFDPEVKTYGHGNRVDIMKQSVLVQDLVSIPEWPQVKLLGNGRVTDPAVELHHPSHRSFHQTPLTDEQEARGLTRFYRWHIDAALYDLNPPRVTTLLGLFAVMAPLGMTLSAYTFLAAHSRAIVLVNEIRPPLHAE